MNRLYLKLFLLSILRLLNVISPRFIRNSLPPAGPNFSYKYAGLSDGSLLHYTLSQCFVLTRSLSNIKAVDIHVAFKQAAYAFVDRVSIVFVKDALVYGSQGLVSDSRNRLLSDLSPLICPKPGRCHHAELFHFRSKEPTFYINEPLFLLASSGCFGYYHWLFECLPKLSHLWTLDIPASVKYLVPNTHLAFVVESLLFYGVQLDQIISLDDSSKYFCSTLYASTPACPFGSPTPAVLKFLRSRASEVSLSVGSPKFIYLTRADSSYRFVINEHDLVDTLAPLGFQVVELSKLSFRSQVSLFRSAICIVSPHGAGLSNICYLGQGSSIVELFHPEYVNVCFWGISSLLGIAYSYVVGSPVLDSEVYPYRKSFAVSQRDVINALNFHGIS